MLKKLSIALLFATTLLLFAGLLLQTNIKQFAETPADTRASIRGLSIPPGMNLTDISQLLADNGLIRSSLKFRLLARSQNLGSRIQAGEYELRSNMTPSEILGILVQGKIKLNRITIPEGFTLKQIAAAVEAAGLSHAADVKKAAADPEILKQFAIPGTTAEGYLFPETYFLAPKTSAEAIVRAMLRRFETVFSDEMDQRAQALGFSRHEVITLASIVEKETGNAKEYPIIASVFHNRLKKGMRLESDPTVIYGIGDSYDGNITRKHLTTPTPYNTYVISGIPPGPIASPGKEALDGVLNPADTPYLYFVSKNDGSHHFSKTYAEHRRMVHKYQLRK
jgi:UPF0755 protein